MGKTIAIKNVDEELYRKFKAVAALRGITLGEAINEAIKLWLKASLSSSNYFQIETEAERNREVYKKLEGDLLRKHLGKFAVIAGGRLVGVYKTKERALEAVKRLNVKHAIVSRIGRKKPTVVEFGMSLFEGEE